MAAAAVIFESSQTTDRNSDPLPDIGKGAGDRCVGSQATQAKHQ